MSKTKLIVAETMADYLKRLAKKHRIKKIGDGAFSRVFQHPKFNDVVVKVFADKDVSYRRYLKWCSVNHHNRYSPRIISVVKFSQIGGAAYHAAFLEKLEPMPDWKSFVRSMRRAFIDQRAKDTKSILSDLLDSAEVEDIFQAFDTAVNLRLMNPEFNSWWEHIRSYGQKRFDVHQGNVMLRGSQLVFTDPVATEPTSRVDEL